MLGVDDVSSEELDEVAEERSSEVLGEPEVVEDHVMSAYISVNNGTSDSYCRSER